MGIIDKKNLTQENSFPGQDTERLLLERLKNSTTEEDYFRWMLFVVGYYRSIKKIDSAVALLEAFLKKKVADDEKNAHCQLALGQIATDEQRLEAALARLQPGASVVVKVVRGADELSLTVQFPPVDAPTDARSDAPSDAPVDEEPGEPGDTA